MDRKISAVWSSDANTTLTTRKKMENFQTFLPQALNSEMELKIQPSSDPSQDWEGVCTPAPGITHTWPKAETRNCTNVMEIQMGVWVPGFSLHFYVADPNYKSQLPQVLGKCEFGPCFAFHFSNQSSIKMAIERTIVCQLNLGDLGVLITK